MNYKIVIPSYKRAQSIKTKTLATLALYGIPKHKIHIFVASEEELSNYLAENGPDYKYVVGVLGLVPQRNFIQSYFPIGTFLLSLDDDVESFSVLEEGKLAPLRDLEQVIHTGFSECVKHGARLWSVYPVRNAFFMRNTITKDFKFCIGSFFGIINPGDTLLNPQTNSAKEDYIRTIQYWNADYKIVRLNYIAHKTKYYKGTGGLNDEARLSREIDAVNKMLEDYPTLVRRNPKRKGEFPEVLLKRQ